MLQFASNQTAKTKHVDALARYFISTFREDGFLDNETIKILSSQEESLTYGVDHRATDDRAAACRAVKKLYSPTHRSRA